VEEGAFQRNLYCTVNGMLERWAGSDEGSELFRPVMDAPLFDGPEWLLTHNFFPNDLLSGNRESAAFKGKHSPLEL
jgi:hypothetical protein